MKKTGLFHAELCRDIAALGHTQTIVIGDVGLPAPKGVKVIDLAVTKNLPGFLDVVAQVLSEGVFESAVVALEIDSKNPAVNQALSALLCGMDVKKIPHENFKQETAGAQVLVRTGETSPYANVILVGGVNF